MFRDKEFLKFNFKLNRITLGEEYVLGVLYDEFVNEEEKVANVNLERIREVIKYLKENYKDIKICKGRCIPNVTEDTILEDFLLLRWIENIHIEGFDKKKDLKNLPKVRSRLKLIEEEKMRISKKREKEKVARERQDKYGYGIYGIYIDDELIYIGETTRDFKARFHEHKENMENGSSILIYKILRDAKNSGKEVIFKPIIDLRDLSKIENKDYFTQKEIKSMEYALISYLQPKGNVEGIKIPYKF